MHAWNIPLIPHSSPRGLRKDLEWRVRSFNNPSCQPQSLSLFPSTIQMPSQMQALNLESQSPLETSGGYGALSQAGRHLMDNKILDGQRPLSLNAWSGTSQTLTVRSNTSWCMVTTEELLKVGGMEGAAPINEVFKRLHEFSQVSTVGSSFHTVYVGSKFNPTDAPSQGIYPPESLLLLPTQLPPELNRFIINSQSPFTASELCERREKSLHKATKGQQYNAHLRFGHHA